MDTDNKRSSKQALIEAGFKVLHTNPGASLAEVASAAGVGRATLHRYFSSRERLVSELAQIAISEMDTAVEEACRHSQTAFEALRDSMQALIPLGDRYGFLMHEFVEQDEAVIAEFERQQRETEELVSAIMDEGKLDRAVPVRWVVRSYEYLIYAAWDSVYRQELTPAQAGDLAWRSLIQGTGVNT